MLARALIGSDATRLPARAADASAARTAPAAAMLLLRPEMLALAREGEAVNPLTLAIEEVVQFGDSALLIGRSNGVPIRARIAGRDAQGMAPGAQVPLAWHPESAHLIAS